MDNEQTSTLGANNEPNLLNELLLVESPSSHIQAIGHLKNTLVIQFNTGEKWKYDPVTRDAYIEFLKSKSHGKYFHKNIKGNSMLNAGPC